MPKEIFSQCAGLYDHQESCAPTLRQSARNAYAVLCRQVARNAYAVGAVNGEDAANASRGCNFTVSQV